MRGTFYRAIVAVTLLSGCASRGADEQEPIREAVSHVWKGANSTTSSVVLVKTPGYQNDGSGIVVGERCILTAGHVAAPVSILKKPPVYWTEKAGADPSKSNTSKYARVIQADD